MLGCFAGAYHRGATKLPLGGDKVPVAHRVYFESAGNDEISSGKFAGFVFNPNGWMLLAHIGVGKCLLNSQNRSRFAVYE